MSNREAADALDRRPVGELSFTDASHQLDEIVAFFEQRDVDVDEMVARLERATAIVDELDRRLRRTRAQVEELVPRLSASASPEGDRRGAAPEEPVGPDDIDNIDDVDDVELVEEPVMEEVDVPADDEAIRPSGVAPELF